MNGNGAFITDNYIYRGLVQNGLFHGFGRYEDKSTKMIYEGNFNEGMRDGFGREYGLNSNGLFEDYEGFWEQGQKSGEGK